jgi:AAA+ ATPase superfamily predicted ATPase
LDWYKLLFDERPKTTKRDLYDMERQLANFVSAIRQGDPMILIVGLRRTGKTSLLQTGLAEAKLPGIIVDLRAIGEKPYATKKDLLQLLESSVNTFLAEQKGHAGRVIDRLKGIKGVQVMGTGVSFSWAGKEPLQIVDMLKLLEEMAGREKHRFIIAFDEAQELGKIAGFNVQKILAHVYDYFKNTSIVLTGSAIGLLRDFIGTDDPDAPLYGRAITEIVLGRLSEGQSRDFLQKGFEQLGTRPNEKVLGEALVRLDGIIGWLTLFGSICKREGVSASSIGKVREIGKSMARKEFLNFLAPRQIAKRRYMRIMKNLASNPATWSEIKRSVQVLEGRTVNDRGITDLINTLVKAGFIEKTGELYQIGDPLLAEAIR